MLKVTVQISQSDNTVLRGFARLRGLTHQQLLANILHDYADVCADEIPLLRTQQLAWDAALRQAEITEPVPF